MRQPLVIIISTASRLSQCVSRSHSGWIISGRLPASPVDTFMMFTLSDSVAMKQYCPDKFPKTSRRVKQNVITPRQSGV